MEKHFESGKQEYRKDPPGVVYNPSSVGKSGFRFDYILNGIELPPHYIQAMLIRDPHVVGYGTWHEPFNEKAVPKYKMRAWPHKHACPEYFIIFGTDIEDPQNLGGTVEFWMGEGEEAEVFITSKPTVILVPKNTLHLPQALREINRPYLQFVIFDSTLWSGFPVPKLPQGFSVDKIADENLNKTDKYKKLVNTRNVDFAGVFPSHQGKAYTILHHDMRQNDSAPHYIEINMIYGANIGWGCGDMMQFSEYQYRSLPHIHDVVETYCFFGTDEDHIEDLGGTVEFWIGEGANSKEYIINKPTIITIPPNTVHLPLYVREVHNPFVSAAFLDSPLWAGIYSDVFPPGFQHVAADMQI